MNTLELKNAHPRDKHITFDEGPHVYTIDGDSDFMSVTTWNHMHFQQFDADLIIDKMMKGRNWKQSKYFGQTKEAIKASWDKNRDDAAEAGTDMHHDIECFYNGVNVDPIRKQSPEYKYFEKFAHDYRHLTAFRTEWMIYDKELKFAGSIDMVFKTPEGTYEIYDWKRSKEIKMENSYSNATTACIRHLPDCNYYHYSLQLNTYKALLEKNYGIKISGMYLVCLHPYNSNKSYQRIKVNDLSTEIKHLFEYRKKMLDKGNIPANIVDEDECWIGSDSE